jgi:signal transduction histidine kinase
LFGSVLPTLSAYRLFSAIYTIAALLLLVLGLGGALAAAVPSLHDQLDLMTVRGQALAPLASAMGSAALSTEPRPQIALDYLVSALNLCFGLFLISRLPGQRVATLLGLGMIGAATSFNAHAHSALLSSSLVYSAGLNELHLGLHVLSGAAYLYALLLFPDGRPALRGANFLMGLIIASAVASIVLFHTDVLFFVVLFGFLIPSLGLVSLGSRIRSTTDARARQQVGVVAWALALVLLSALVVLVVAFGPLLAGRPALIPAAVDQVEYVSLELFSILFALIPIALFVGIVRYQLFDIRVLARTLLYFTFTACIVGLYVLIVGTLDVIFGTGNSVPVSLLATGSIAVLFQPLRERLQRAAQHLVYGEREPYLVLTRLGRQLESTLTPEAVLPTIVETVREALELPYVSVVLQGEDEPAVSSGTVIDPSLRLPLVYQRETVGELRLAARGPDDALTAAERRLLGALARQAGAAVYGVQVTADLQRARAQLVSAREEERRRLRRDLHDGLGPALAGQLLRAGAARRVLPDDAAAADVLLAELEADLEQAVADLRRLVYNLRPPALDELGLAGAIRASAIRLGPSSLDGRGLTIGVDIPDMLPPLTAAVEVAVYRLVEEALTNVVRHARARHCRVRLTVGDQLDIEVVDDGTGLSSASHPGLGLVSMRERAEELGGTCRVESLPAGGTRVHARLPVRAAVVRAPVPDVRTSRIEESQAIADTCRKLS